MPPSPLGRPGLRTAGLAAAAALGCACAGAPPAPSWTAGADQPASARERAVSAVGRSDRDAAGADLAARGKVAARVAPPGGRFPHPELIRVTAREQDGGAFYALATLDRAEADATLARDVQPEAARFALLCDRALRARGIGRSGEFGTAAQAADLLRPRLDASFAARRAVLGQPAADEAAFLARRQALAAAETEAAAHAVVEVRADGGPPQLLPLALAAVRKLGLRAVQDVRCEDASEWAAEDTTELVLEPDETCAAAAEGERCAVSVRVHARGCKSGQGEGRVAQASATHPDDRRRARAAAWAHALDAASVEAAVREALKTATYLSCRGPGCR